MLAGPVIFKFDNSAPITAKGEWNISVGVPVTRHYGQGKIGADGNVKPGSGYLGSAPGTAQSVSGSFRFAVDQTGEAVKQTILRGLFKLFTVDWPVGDMASAEVKAKAIDAKFDNVTFEHGGPEGKYEITGSMSAGEVQGLEPDDL